MAGEGCRCVAGWWGSVGQVGAMRTCVRSARTCCRTPSRYLLERSRLYLELTTFAGNRVWAPEAGCRGVLWMAL